MSKGIAIVVAIIVGIIAGSIGMYMVSEYLPANKESREVAKSIEEKGEKKILYWQAPMDPTFISDKPGKSPVGMDLIPVYEGEEETTEPGTVKIDPVTVQNIGVRTARLKRMLLKKTIRTIGRIDYDERKVYRIDTNIDGWVEKLYVNFTGMEVKKDDILLEIYSPTLISAQEEYLLARRYSKDIKKVGRESIMDLSRRRLELWDVPEHQLKELEEKGVIMKTLHIHSPTTGIVTEKPVTEGMYVKPGMSVYTIADISNVWAYVDVYEYEMPWIKTGQEAEMTLASYPGEVFIGQVTFVYPFMEPKTRTVKVRLEFENPEFKLKPEMYANVTLKSVISKDAVAVPSEAVIMSGERNIVVLSRGGGKFTPKEVTLGAEAEGYYEVLKGLKQGDEVVISAQFLIDSESRLKEAIGKMLKKKEPGAPMKRDSMDQGEGMDHGTMKPRETNHSGMEIMDHGSMEQEDMEHKDMKSMERTPMSHDSMKN